MERLRRSEQSLKDLLIPVISLSFVFHSYKQLIKTSQKLQSGFLHSVIISFFSSTNNICTTWKQFLLHGKNESNNKHVYSVIINLSGLKPTSRSVTGKSIKENISLWRKSLRKNESQQCTLKNKDICEMYKFALLFFRNNRKYWAERRSFKIFSLVFILRCAFGWNFLSDFFLFLFKKDIHAYPTLKTYSKQKNEKYCEWKKELRKQVLQENKRMLLAGRQKTCRIQPRERVFLHL